MSTQVPGSVYPPSPHPGAPVGYGTYHPGLHQYDPGVTLPFGNHATLSDGLVSYWALDETSGSRADSVGSNTLTDNNTVLYQNLGPQGVVADFVAANSEYLSANPGIGVMTGDYTVAGWVNFTDYSGYTAVDGAGYFAIIENNVDGAMVCAVLPGGQAQLLWWDSGTLRRAFTAAPGDGWHHVVMRNASGTKTIWIDGTSRGLTTGTTGSGWGNTKTSVGRSYAGAGYYFNSTVARLGVWNGTALAEAEIVSLYNSGFGKSYAEMTAAEKTGLTAFWNLDEASGARADSHGSYTLTDNNTVTSVDNTHPNFGKVASFVAASSEYLNNAAVVFDWTSDWALSLWLKRAYSAGTEGYFCGGANEARIYSGGAAQLIVEGNGANTITYGSADSNWTHLVFHHNNAATEIRMYVNGSEVGSGTASNPDTQNGQIVLGALSGGASPGNLQLGHTALWSRVLTAQERTDLYNAGAGLFY